MMKVILVCGTRPNFMKVAPLMRAISKHNACSVKNPIKPILVHTGQHYDYRMSKVFFEDLSLPEPDVYLGVGSGTHSEQTGKIMIELEKVLLEEEPDLVTVVGDVNSTLAGALAAVKLHIPVAHIEAGLRSFDRAMPEEINRILTDAISDYLFTTSTYANENLLNEGMPEDKVFLVGDVMIDSLFYHRAKAQQSLILSKLGLMEKDYALLTLHRPSNVDVKESLLKILQAVREISQQIPVVFPAHPRTRKNIADFALTEYLDKQHILFIEPVGYLDFLKLMVSARFIMTDSGGIQEETTALNIPCLTLRDTTERPETISQGTNTLVWNDTKRIVDEALNILNGEGKSGSCPELWDGGAAERIVEILAKAERV